MFLCNPLCRRTDAFSQTDTQGLPKAVAAAAAAAAAAEDEKEFRDVAAAMQHIMQQRQALQVDICDSW